MFLHALALLAYRLDPGDSIAALRLEGLVVSLLRALHPILLNPQRLRWWRFQRLSCCAHRVRGRRPLRWRARGNCCLRGRVRRLESKGGRIWAQSRRPRESSICGVRLHTFVSDEGDAVCSGGLSWYVWQKALWPQRWAIGVKGHWGICCSVDYLRSTEGLFGQDDME